MQVLEDDRPAARDHRDVERYRLERRVLRRRRRKPCGAGPHRRCIRPERPPPSLGGGLLSERRSTVLDPDVQARRMLVTGTPCRARSRRVPGRGARGRREGDPDPETEAPCASVVVPASHHGRHEAGSETHRPRRNRRAPGPAAGSRAPLAAAGLPAAARARRRRDPRAAVPQPPRVRPRAAGFRRCEDALALDEPQTEP